MELRSNRQDILIVDLVTDEASALIKLYVEASGKFRLTRFGLMDVGNREKLKTFPFEAAIFNCDYLGREEVEQLTLLSIRLGERPILVCANQIALHSYRFVDRFPNIVTIQKPFRATQFKEIFRQISTGKDYRPKVCPRFLTSEEVEIVVLNSGRSVKSQMKNYSAGGMFVEIEGVELSIGDPVQVTVRAAAPGDREVRKSHYSGRIVWKKSDARSAVSGVGLEFT